MAIINKPAATLPVTNPTTSQNYVGSSGNTVIDTSSIRRVDSGGVLGADTLRFIPIDKDWNANEGKIIEHLELFCNDNDVDEVLIKGDNGSYYLIYADDISELQTGDTFTSNEIRGEVVHVQREIDFTDAAIRVAGHGLAAFFEYVGLQTGIVAPVLVAGLALNAATEKVVDSRDRDLGAYQKLTQPMPHRLTGATDPRDALAPQSATANVRVNKTPSVAADIASDETSTD